MAYEYFYPGTPYSLDPRYGAKNEPGSPFVDYRINSGEFGLPTDPRIANKLAEVSMKLNPGSKSIELTGISPDIFDSIPKQHFKEINRQAKLVNATMTVHGPLIEASGYTREGWSEASRQESERQMKSVIERVHDLNPEGNIPVTFHSTAVGLPEGEERAMEQVNGERKAVPKSMWVVDPRTGSLHPIKYTEKFFPGEQGKKFNPDEELTKLNKDIWTQEIGQINFSALRGEEVLESFDTERVAEKLGMERGEIENEKPEIFKAYARSRVNPQEFNKLPDELKKGVEPLFRRLDHASIFLKDAYRQLRENYNKVYGDADEEDKKKLEAYAEKIMPLVKDGVPEDKAKLDQFSKNVIEEGIKVLGNITTPKIFRKMDDFVIDQSSKTFASAALEGWKKFGDTAPIVSIENPPAGMAISRADELRKLVEESRKKFVEQAVKDGHSKSEAENAANKLIGVTWDVGHINMLKKFGYNDEDLVDETGKVKKLVKHVHLSDNFGMEHTELPMGMGNVPIKAMMEKLGKEGQDAKKVIEAGNWWQHFKTPPVGPTLEAFGSPLYPMLAQPYWNQIASTYGNYFAFPSAYLPEQHFSLYGTGFSNLPQELGGQIPGRQNRLTGTPME